MASMVIETLIDTFISRCDAYAARRGISRSRLSTLLFNDGKKLEAFIGGRDIGIRKLAEYEDRLGELEKALPEAVQ